MRTAPDRTRMLAAGAVTALFGLVLLVRLHARQPGLLYPDGYQYLLMARGIAAHLTPTVRLGPGGDLFVPSVDAALKPLFPALVAVLSPVAGSRAAASAITLVGAAATVVLSALLAARLAGSRAAGIVAAVAALASPALAYWSGFAGPDTLAQALALATVLAVSHARGRLAGALGALCVATRPEWGLVLLALAAAALTDPASRALAGRALISGAFVLAGLIGILRPPLAVPVGGLALALGAIAAGAVLQLLACWAGAERSRATVAGCSGLAVLAAAGLATRTPALAHLARDEWPLLLVAAAGIACACASGRGRPALMLLAGAPLLAAVYAYRNPGSERYLAQLLPFVCVAAGFVVAGAVSPRAVGVGARRIAVPAAATALVLAPIFTAATRPGLASDAFASLAGRLAGLGQGPLVAAAPDAYGFLLPGRAQRMLRPGARGLILLDGAQRAYAPGLSVQGIVVARLTAPAGFERPDGRLDRGAALLVRGVALPAAPRQAGSPARPNAAVVSAASAIVRSIEAPDGPA